VRQKIGIGLVVVLALLGVWSAFDTGRAWFRETTIAHRESIKLARPAHDTFLITEPNGTKRLVTIGEVLEILAKERVLAAQQQQQKAEAAAQQAPAPPQPPGK
jgi:hypothetical protein